jgi:hypothetical protein
MIHQFCINSVFKMLSHVTSTRLFWLICERTGQAENFLPEVNQFTEQTYKTDRHMFLESKQSNEEWLPCQQRQTALVLGATLRNWQSILPSSQNVIPLHS